jgi:hypothetical protein
MNRYSIWNMHSSIPRKAFMCHVFVTVGMGDQLHPTVDEDIYQQVCDEHERTGRSKSRVVNRRLRQSYQEDSETLADTVLPTFGQSLFVAGFIVALLEVFTLGLGTTLIGLGLMIGAKVDEYSESHGVPAHVALVRVLGA